jgi:hypothetical protein
MVPISFGVWAAIAPPLPRFPADVANATRCPSPLTEGSVLGAAASASPATLARVVWPSKRLRRNTSAT